MRQAWTVGLVALAVWTSSEAAETARSFLVSALQSDNTEVKLGLLAEARGSSNAVKQLARKLKLDHFESRRRAFKLARRLHVHLPQGADRRERGEYSRLVRLRGGAFDREYIRYVISAEQRQLQMTEGTQQAPPSLAQLANSERGLLQREIASATELNRAIEGVGSQRARSPAE